MARFVLALFLTVTAVPERYALSLADGVLSEVRVAPWRIAWLMAPARTSLPWESVLTTSTVLPPALVKTSPGFIAVPLGMFSQDAMTAIPSCENRTEEHASELQSRQNLI